MDFLDFTVFISGDKFFPAFKKNFQTGQMAIFMQLYFATYAMKLSDYFVER